MIDFVPFPKIARLRRDVVITEKIVIHHAASGHSYKVTLERDDEWKGKEDGN
jgi:hypothetical protein